MRLLIYQIPKKNNLTWKVNNMSKLGTISWKDFDITYTSGTFNIEAKGESTVLDQYEFTDFMQRQGEKLADIDFMIGTLTEDSKIAELRKYAGSDYLRFETGATINAYIDDLDLTSSQVVIDIKNSTLSSDEKVDKIKEIARELATEKIQELTDAVPGITVSYGSVEQDLDNMNWDDILIDEA